MPETAKIWHNLVDLSNDLIVQYEKNNQKTREVIRPFVDELVNLSEHFVSNRMETLADLKSLYPHFYMQAVNILSNADSVAVIMQANEGINDYLILVNLFRSLLVTLDSLASAYWLKLSEQFHNNANLLKMLVYKSNNAIFDKAEEDTTYNTELEKSGVIFDTFFATKMNQIMWSEIVELDHNIIFKNQGNFEYFKELLAATDHLAEDMIINLWAVLAVVFSYLDYLSHLLEA